MLDGAVYATVLKNLAEECLALEPSPTPYFHLPYFIYYQHE